MCYFLYIYVYCMCISHVQVCGLYMSFTKHVIFSPNSKCAVYRAVQAFHLSVCVFCVQLVHIPFGFWYFILYIYLYYKYAIFIPNIIFGTHLYKCINVGMKQCMLVCVYEWLYDKSMNGKGATRNNSMCRSMCYMVDSLLK